MIYSKSQFYISFNLYKVNVQLNYVYQWKIIYFKFKH